MATLTDQSGWKYNMQGIIARLEHLFKQLRLIDNTIIHHKPFNNAL